MTSLLAMLAALLITGLSAAGLAPALYQHVGVNIFHLFLGEFIVCFIALIMLSSLFAERRQTSTKAPHPAG